MIKGMIVNKEELLKEIKEIRTELKKLNGIGADEKLAGLQRRLSEELEQKEFQLYDKVRIISVDRDPKAIYPDEFLYKIGRIEEIEDNHYSYVVNVEDVNNSLDWAWKAEDLRLVGRA